VAVQRHRLDPELLGEPAHAKRGDAVGVRQGNGSLQYSFPDKHFEIEDVIAEGDKVVLRWRFSGTHEGPFWTPVGTMPGTSRQLELAATLTYRIEEGKIAEEWAAIDWLSVVQQLGGTCTAPAGE
jgi:predicted ester cyclase